MKQVSRSGEGTGELARLDGVKTGAQMGGQKIVAIIVVAQGRTVLVKLPLGGVWSIANRDEVTIQARQQGRVKGVYRIANRIVACIRRLPSITTCFVGIDRRLVKSFLSATMWWVYDEYRQLKKFVFALKALASDEQSLLRSLLLLAMLIEEVLSVGSALTSSRLRQRQSLVEWPCALFWSQ